MNIITREEKEKQEAAVFVRKKKLKKKIVSIAVVFFVVIALLAMVFIYGQNYAKTENQKEIQELKQQIEELENTPVVVNPVTPEIVQGILTSQITGISEIASAEYLFTNAAKFTASSSDSWLTSWVTQKSFIQKWDGTIKAGVDLSNIAIDIKDAVITITLPAAKILSYEIDYNSVEVLDEKNNIFNPITVDDKNDFDKATAEAMKQRAVENGLLDKAQANAENIITSLLVSALEIGEEYTIQFVYIEKQ